MPLTLIHAISDYVELRLHYRIVIADGEWSRQQIDEYVRATE